MRSTLVVARQVVNEASRRRLLIALVLLTLVVIALTVWGVSRIDDLRNSGQPLSDAQKKTIVSQLEIKLLPNEKKVISQVPTQNVEAYTYYLQGRQFFHYHTKRFLQLGRQMFTKAVTLDPGFARAYAGIANCDPVTHLVAQASRQQVRRHQPVQ